MISRGSPTRIVRFLLVILQSFRRDALIRVYDAADERKVQSLGLIPGCMKTIGLSRVFVDRAASASQAGL